MPRPNKRVLLSSNQTRPAATEIFTDRETEQNLIRNHYLSLKQRDLESACKILSFYGVGGIGKTSLINKAIRDVSHSEKLEINPVSIAKCNIDSSQYTPDYGVMQFYGEVLIKSLYKAGVRLPAFEAYYLAWWGKAHPDVSLSRQQIVCRILGIGEKSAEAGGSVTPSDGVFSILGDLASATKVVSATTKVVAWLQDKKNLSRFNQCFSDINLGELDLKDFDKYAADVIFADLVDLFPASAYSSLSIVIDGFERIQSEERRNDLQESLAQLFGSVVTCSPPLRVGLILSGRERLRWREHYDDVNETEHWDKYIDHHLIGGLSEPDARLFLIRAKSWYENSPSLMNSNVPSLIAQHAEAILEQAEEEGCDSLQRIFHPYSLDLALQQIIDHSEKFTPDLLGKGASDLEGRFLRYMDSDKRTVLQILAIGQVFNSEYFDRLIRNHFAHGIAGVTFHKLVSNNTYVVNDSEMRDVFRFHKKMQAALLHNLRRSESGKKLFRPVLDFFIHNEAVPKIKSGSHCAGRSAEESYEHASSLLTFYFKNEDISFADWEALFWATQEAAGAFFSLVRRRDLVSEAIEIMQGYSADGLLIAKYFNELGTINKELGLFKSSEIEYSIALEHARGSPDGSKDLLARILHNYGIVLKEAGKNSIAETLLYEAASLYSTIPERRSNLALLKVTLASILRTKNEPDALSKAIEIGEQSVEELRRFDPGFKLNFALNGLAVSYRKIRTASSLTKAIELHKDALNITIGAKGDNHPDTAYNLYLIGNAYEALGDQGKAIAAIHYEQASSILDAWGFANTHPYHLRIKECLDRLAPSISSEKLDIPLCSSVIKQ